MPHIEILSAVICDEVRQEATGRAIVIGAAPIGREVSSSEETTIPRIAFYLEAFLTEVSAIEFRLISEDGDDTPIEVRMELNSLSDEQQDGEPSGIIGTIVFGREQVKIRSAGLYRLQYLLADDEWKTVRDVIFPPAESDQ